MVSNYSSGSVAALPIKADGSLGEPATFIRHKPAAGADAMVVSHAHCIVMSPDNRFALAADLGLDQVISYRLDPRHRQAHPVNATIRYDGLRGRMPSGKGQAAGGVADSRPGGDAPRAVPRGPRSDRAEGERTSGNSVALTAVYRRRRSITSKGSPEVAPLRRD